MKVKMGNVEAGSKRLFNLCPNFSFKVQFVRSDSQSKWFVGEVQVQTCIQAWIVTREFHRGFECRGIYHQAGVVTSASLMGAYNGAIHSLSQTKVIGHDNELPIH